LTYAVNKAITVATTIALARLVAPREFGLVALATLTVQTISLFNDLGMGGALVLRQDLDRRAVGTMLTLMVGMHTVIALVIFATAPLAALAFGEPRLTGILAALSGGVVLSGVSWFQEALLQRELQFRRRFLAQAAQSGTYAGVALALAFAGAQVWSIVIGQIAAVGAYTLALFALLPWRVRPAFDRAAARDAFATGRGFLVQGGLAFLRGNVDYFAVGRILGARQLGFYSMAYRLGELPYYAIADPVARVTFPAFARMRARGEDVAPRFLTTLRLVALVSCPLGVLLSAAAGPFTRAVLGPAWLPMIGPLEVLGVWAALRPLQVTIGWLLNSVGQAGLMGTLSAVILLPLLLGVCAAAWLGSITTVALVMLTEVVISLIACAIFVQRRAGVTLARQWKAVEPVAAACPLAWLAAAGVSRLHTNEPALLTLLGSVAAGTLVYAAVVSLVAPGTFPYALRRAREMVSRPAVLPGG
jgi:PST family polysaccharide transporter